MTESRQARASLRVAHRVDKNTGLVQQAGGAIKLESIVGAGS
jgi:hypothetical protein